jgi:hypothetical protein
MATAYFFVFFVSLNLPPNTKGQHPPICSAPAALTLHHPFHCFCQLFVDCYFFWPNGGHLRPTLPLSLFFYVSCFVTPNKGNSHRKCKPSAGCLQWTNKEQRCNDLGMPLPYPWWERAKPVEGRVAGAHVGCHVLWLCCVVWCVWGSLATMLVVQRY